MADLHFSIMQLIEHSSSRGERLVTPTKGTFQNLEESFSYNKDGSFYEIIVENQDEYIYFIFKFGNPEPRDENLTNIKTGDKTPNKRTTEEAELNHQIFFLFHYENALLYMSDSRMKSLFESILKEKIQTDFSVKSLFKSEEEFINTLKECRRIKFTHINDLFSNDSKQRQALIDLSGTDAPERFEIWAQYPKSSNVVNFIKTLIQGKRDNKISSLVIQGIDESGINSVYDLDVFKQRIKISCPKDENGKFVTNDVRDNLLREIRNERF